LVENLIGPNKIVHPGHKGLMSVFVMETWI